MRLKSDIITCYNICRRKNSRNWDFTLLSEKFINLVKFKNKLRRPYASIVNYDYILPISAVFLLLILPVPIPDEDKK